MAVAFPNTCFNMSPCGNIVLVGLSGAGKTSCAQILAELLDLAVLDSDEIIQRESGRTVAEIFAQEGEPHFRALERQLIEGLLNQDSPLKNTVLSVGGGLPVHGDNIHLLKKIGFTVFLNAAPSTLARRLAEDLSRDHSLRPLLNQILEDQDKNTPSNCKEESLENQVTAEANKNLELRLSELLAGRLKYYEEAHLVINTDGKSKQDICREIQTIIVNNVS